MNKVIVRNSSKNTLQQSNIPPLLKKIYSNRGITSVQELEMGLKYLLNFNKLKDIDKGVSRLYEALIKQESVLIVGDFDADGATSTALAMTALSAFGFKKVNFLVPNRFEQGYGLSVDIVEIAKQSNPALIITVDNGIASCDGVEVANKAGIDVLITDHHLSPDVLPKAVAIINPNQADCHFESKNIAGVGVIFYVMLALRRKLQDENYFQNNNIVAPNMASFLDLVALGTVCDVVPLDKNNRILVSLGLARIRASKCRLGITALINIGKRDPTTLQSTDLGFVVGPRLNAAGRLDDMSLGIECLITTNEKTASTLAKTLDDLNIERRQIEGAMKEDALDIINALHLNSEKMPLGLCLYDENWHQGVIGIIAGRLKEKYNRPTIIFAKGDNHTIKGSARSIPTVHIRDLLDVISKKSPTIIDKFGGHAMAAGLTIRKDKLSEFKKLFESELSNYMDINDCIGRLYSDGELDLVDFSLKTASMIESAGPWGQAFPKPLFDNEFELIEQRLLGGKHLKMVLRIKGAFDVIDAIAFNINDNEWPNYRANKIHCAYYLDINRYQGRSRLQLMVENLTPILD